MATFIYIYIKMEMNFMYEDIKNNKIKTGVIISLFFVMIALIVYYICMAFDLGYMSLVFALTFSIITSVISYYNSDKIVLAMSNARKATPEENKKLINILDALVISSGISVTPKLYIVDDAQPNAFATGRDPEHSVICVTTGLLDKLDYYELESVIGHELSHITNYDIRLSCVVSVMVGFVIMLSDFFTRSFLRSGRSRSNSKNSGGNAIFMLIGLLFLILAPIFGKLIQLAISRKREFLADATSVKYTRNPDAMISALKKISSDPNELHSASKSTAHMYISSPFRNKKFSKSSVWSTHPSLDERVEAIKKLK